MSSTRTPWQLLKSDRKLTFFTASWETFLPPSASAFLIMAICKFFLLLSSLLLSVCCYLWSHCRDESVQLVCLKLVLALLRQLKTCDIVSMLSTLTSFVDSRSVACRAAAYDVFMWLYDNYANATGSVTVYYSVFSTCLLEWNPLEHWDCSRNFLPRHKGLFYSKMDRNIFLTSLCTQKNTDWYKCMCV